MGQYNKVIIAKNKRYLDFTKENNLQSWDTFVKSDSHNKIISKQNLDVEKVFNKWYKMAINYKKIPFKTVYIVKIVMHYI